MTDSPGPPPKTSNSDEASSHQRTDHYAPGTGTSLLDVDTDHQYLVQDCKTTQYLPFEEFAIKILRLPEDWKAQWSTQLSCALELDEWVEYEKAYNKEGHNESILYHPFTELCNKAITKMTGGQDDSTDSLVVVKEVEGKLDGGKVFVGFNNEAFKNISWGQIRTFQEVKKTTTDYTFGEHLTPKFGPQRRSQVKGSDSRSGVTSSSSSKNRASATIVQTSVQGAQKRSGVVSSSSSKKRSLAQSSTQGPQKRHKSSESAHTFVGSHTLLLSGTSKSGQLPRGNNHPEHVRSQCAGYALELLTGGHAFGILVDGPNIQLHYYDRSMIVKTEGITLFDMDERELFLAVLFRFTQLTPAQWGTMLNIDDDEGNVGRIAKDDQVDPLAGMEFTLEKGGVRKRVRLIRRIFRSHGIIGRGTIVAEAECICGSIGCECDWKECVIVKISFPATSRVTESELVVEALSKAEGEYEWVRKHLPVILWAQTITFDEDTPQAQLAKLYPEKYEARHAYVTVLKKLQPIHDLETVEEVAQAFYDILQCHRWLYKVAKILHRDISLSNIMFHRDPGTGEVYGVLNDFDLSSRVAENRIASSKERTGTKPYMAYDLCNSQWTLGHFYRHDLESIFYCILCFSTRFETPKKAVANQEAPYDVWFTGDYTRVRDSKSTFILQQGSDSIRSDIKKFFEKLGHWLVTLHISLKAGYAAKLVAEVENESPEEETLSGESTFTLTAKESFEEETLGGKFTYTHASRIMSHLKGSPLKMRSPKPLD